MISSTLTQLGGGLHCTEVAFPLLTQQPWVQIPALLLSLWTVEIGEKNRIHVELKQMISQMQFSKGLRKKYYKKLQLNLKKDFLAK